MTETVPLYGFDEVARDADGCVVCECGRAMEETTVVEDAALGITRWECACGGFKLVDGKGEA